MYLMYAAFTLGVRSLFGLLVVALVSEVKSLRLAYQSELLQWFVQALDCYQQSCGPGVTSHMGSWGQVTQSKDIDQPSSLI